ncbi:MAG: diguanylate cyclase [Gemmatimonas sp.]
METTAVIDLMFFFIIPLWMAWGVVDYLCHRASDIQHTTGAKESLMHLAMFAEAGTGLVLAMMFEINALVIALLMVLLALHEVTGWWDIGYATGKRHITDVEQHAHSFLEVLPFAALLLLLVIHWGQFLALFGAGPETASWALQWKTPPLPVAYVVTTLGAAVAIEIAPYIEELWRCLRTAQAQLVPPHPVRPTTRRQPS